jgi:hypothetical protein
MHGYISSDRDDVATVDDCVEWKWEWVVLVVSGGTRKQSERERRNERLD